MTAATGTTTLLPTGRPWIADAARRLVTRRWSTAAVVRVLLAVFVLAAAGVALDGDSRGRADALAAAHHDTRLAAGLAARELGSGIAQLDAAVTRTAAAPDIDTLFARPAPCDLGFDARVLAAGRIDVVRDDGAVVCSSRAASIGHRYPATTWLATARSGSVVSDPVVDPVTDRPVIVRTAPVAGRGVVAGVVSLEAFGHQLAQRFAGPDHMQIVVTTRGGTVVAGSAVPAEGAGSAVGDARLWSRATVAGTGWSIRAGLSRADVLAPSRGVFDRELWIIVGAVAAILFLTFLGHRYVMRPIRRMSFAVRATAQDPGTVWGHPVPMMEEGPREIAELAGAVNDLVQAGASRERGEPDTPPSGSPSGSLGTTDTEPAYRMLFETHPLPMWIHDIETLEFLAVNDAAVAQYGHARDDFLSLTVREVLAPRSGPAGATGAAGKAGAGRTGPWRHRRGDGSLFDAEVRARTLQFAGSRRVLHRRRGRHAAKASGEQGSRRAAHGGTGPVGGRSGPRLQQPARGDRELLRLHRRGHRASRGVDPTARCGSASRRTSARSSPRRGVRTGSPRGCSRSPTRAAANPQVFDPNGLIEDLHPVLRRTVGDHVAVRLELGAAVRRVHLDPGHLEQVLLNLVVNVGEAMPDGGALVIETTDVELDDDDAARHGPIDPGAYVGLRVRDSGVGLGADTLARAFEPFFTTKPAGDGAGLGLATVYGLVTGAGGTVWIESERSDGTTVTALFPAAAETASVDVPTGT